MSTRRVHHLDVVAIVECKARLGPGSRDTFERFADLVITYAAGALQALPLVRHIGGQDKGMPTDLRIRTSVLECAFELLGSDHAPRKDRFGSNIDSQSVCICIRRRIAHYCLLWCLECAVLAALVPQCRVVAFSAPDVWPCTSLCYVDGHKTFPENLERCARE